MNVPISARFLEKDDDELEAGALLTKSGAVRYLPLAKPRYTLMFWLHCFLTCFLSVTTMYFMRRSFEKPADPSQRLYCKSLFHFLSSGWLFTTLKLAPAQEAIEYEIKTFQRGFHNDTTSYQGWPTDEIDILWEELYSSKFFVVTIISW